MVELLVYAIWLIWCFLWVLIVKSASFFFLILQFFFSFLVPSKMLISQFLWTWIPHQGATPAAHIPLASFLVFFFTTSPNHHQRFYTAYLYLTNINIPAKLKHKICCKTWMAFWEIHWLNLSFVSYFNFIQWFFYTKCAGELNYFIFTSKMY